MFAVIKILAVIVGFSGFFAFVEPNGGFFIMPITICLGVLIYSLAYMFEKLIEAIQTKNNENTEKQDTPEQK